MRLTELEPRFVRYSVKREMREFAVGDPATWRARGCPGEVRFTDVKYVGPVNSLAEAQGITFLCPKCFLANKGPVGTHGCGVTFAGRGVPDDLGSHNKDGKPVRWNVSGTGYSDLTTTPSILLEGGCAWHGYITNGEVT